MAIQQPARVQQQQGHMAGLAEIPRLTCGSLVAHHSVILFQAIEVSRPVCQKTSQAPAHPSAVCYGVMECYGIMEVAENKTIFVKLLFNSLFT